MSALDIQMAQLIIRPGAMETILDVMAREEPSHPDLWIVAGGYSEKRNEKYLVIVSPWTIPASLIEQFRNIPTVLDVIVSGFALYPNG